MYRQVRQENCFPTDMDIHLQKLLALHSAVSGLGDFFFSSQKHLFLHKDFWNADRKSVV